MPACGLRTGSRRGARPAGRHGGRSYADYRREAKAASCPLQSPPPCDPTRQIGRGTDCGTGSRAGGGFRAADFGPRNGTAARGARNSLRGRRRGWGSAQDPVAPRLQRFCGEYFGRGILIRPPLPSPSLHGGLTMTGRQTGRRKVLLVDDDASVRSFVTELLTTCGYDPEGVESGEEAVKRLSAGEQPSVMLLDLLLPGMGGMDVLERVKHMGA